MSAPRLVVCGTGFGRVQLEALRAEHAPFELAGILARGSERSRTCAREHGVPLFTDPGQVPDDVEFASVAVMAGVNGGPGTELAQAFLERGVHVMQESPIHHDELAACLRAARRHGVVHRLNTHYVHVEPVRRFLAAARALRERQAPLFVDATCAIQVAFNLFDILGQALGGLRPWSFRACERGDGRAPFRQLAGEIAGVPLTLQVQNELDPSDPDNGAHLLHRVTIGSEGGTLTLLSSHGPVNWSPRPHFPREGRGATALHDVEAAHLDIPSAAPIGPAHAPSYREILRDVWPDGARRALHGFREAALGGADPLAGGQYHLALCRAWQDATSLLGYPETVPLEEPQPLSREDLEANLEVPA